MERKEMNGLPVVALEDPDARPADEAAFMEDAELDRSYERIRASLGRAIAKAEQLLDLLVKAAEDARTGKGGAS